MVTIATYYRLESAQQEADIIATKGFEVEIEQGPFTGPYGGNQPSFYLKVHEEDLEELDKLRDEILAEVLEHNPYHCPKCQSKNYEPHRYNDGLMKSLFRMFLGGGPTLSTTNTLFFKCLDCQTEFKVDISEE